MPPLPNPPPTIRSADGAIGLEDFYAVPSIEPVHVHADARAVAGRERQRHPAAGPDADEAQRQIRDAQADGVAQAISPRRAD